MADPESLLADFGRTGSGLAVPVADVMARGDRRRHRRQSLITGGVVVVLLGIGGLTYDLALTGGRNDSLVPAQTAPPSPPTQPTPPASSPPAPALSSPATSPPSGAPSPVPSPPAPSPPATSPPATSPPVALRAEDRLTLEGVGPIRIGMTYAELQAATGRTVRVTNFESTVVGLGDTATACTYITLQGVPISDLSFIGGDGRLQAVGALGSSVRLTQSGVTTGDTEAQVRQVYGSALSESPTILGIRYLSVVSGGRSLSVGIQNGVAVELWVGETDYTQLPEGCV